MATVAYQGTAYHGFQRQSRHPTIQGELEKALGKICGHSVSLVGAGRTDRRVHATGQVISFDVTGTIPTDRIPAAANTALPRDIRINDAREVEADFDARRNALAKLYRYVLYSAPVALPFYRDLAGYSRQRLDVNAMNRACDHIRGKSDFSSFWAAGSAGTDPVRDLFYLRVHEVRVDERNPMWGWQGQDRGQCLYIDAAADGFLYKMVRNIVGLLTAVGRGELDELDAQAVVEARDRRAAPPTGRPQGLYLVKVFYKKEEFANLKNQ